MKIQGTVIWVGEPKSGVSQKTGNAWKSVDFVVTEDSASELPEEYLLSTMNDKVVDNIKPGMKVECEFFHHVRFWEQGQKYFWNINCREVHALATAPQPAAQHAQQKAQGQPQPAAPQQAVDAVDLMRQKGFQPAAQAAPAQPITTNTQAAPPADDADSLLF